MTRTNSIRNREGKSAARNRSMAASAERCPADFTLRKSGIGFVASTRWGAHICVFYETKEDLLDTAISYFEAGLESNEVCVWAVSDPISLEDATNSVRRVIPDGERYLGSGRIEILPASDWYLKEDRFDLKRIIAGWNEKLSRALMKGYEGMRVSGNALWLETKHWKE